MIKQSLVGSSRKFIMQLSSHHLPIPFCSLYASSVLMLLLMSVFPVVNITQFNLKSLSVFLPIKIRNFFVDILPLSFIAFPGGRLYGKLLTGRYSTSGGLVPCLLCCNHLQMITIAQMISTTEEVFDEHFAEL